LPVTMKFVLVLLLTVASAYAFKYTGYRTMEVGPLKTEDEIKFINGLIDHDERVKQVILLNDAVVAKTPLILVVAPDIHVQVQDMLTETNIPFTVLDHDAQASFDANMKDNEERLLKIKNFRDDPTQFDHTAYLRYADQVAWINSKAQTNPIATAFNLGASYGNRQIRGMTINANTNLPGVWIDSNIHAREWISSATVLYIIDEILTGTSADAVYLRQNYRWYFVPNLNPDGYEYTHTNDRLWRKTRSPNAGSTCVGTDPNRNWASNWCGEGASNSPCSDTYCGARAFSEAETTAARNYLQNIRAHTQVFVSVHCYSNFWLVPWGGYSSKPSDYSDLMRVGNAAATAIRGVNGLQFTVGTPPDILYVASGGSFDWAKESNGMKWAYSPELRPATQAQGGFNIPASNIVPSGREIFAAFVAMLRAIYQSG